MLIEKVNDNLGLILTETTVCIFMFVGVEGGGHLCVCYHYYYYFSAIIYSSCCNVLGDN